MTVGIAPGAGADDEPVRQKQLSLGIVKLIDRPNGDVTRLFQARVDQFRQFAIFIGMGRIVIVVTDQKVGKIPFMLVFDPGDQGLRLDPEFFRLEHHGGAVGVVGTDIDAFVAPQPLKAHPDIGLDVLEQMAQMNRAIGVGQRAGNENMTLFHENRGRISKGAKYNKSSHELRASGCERKAATSLELRDKRRRAARCRHCSKRAYCEFGRRAF